MGASKAQIGLKLYIKDKPTKCGYKLFVLADLTNGYTFEFSIYTGKYEQRTYNGLSYDVVQQLIRMYIGQGYMLFIDNFYTSPTLLTDLYANNTVACGTVRENHRRRQW